MMKYKGYSAKVEFDPDAEILHGEIADIADVITFQAESVADLKKEFEFSVDDYLEFCAERGREPQKPYSGKFVVRMTPEFHREAAIAAKRADVSLNAFVLEALQLRLTSGHSHAKPNGPALEPRRRAVS